MSSFTNIAKSAASSFTNLTKSTTRVLNYMRHGVVASIDQYDRTFDDPYYPDDRATGDITGDEMAATTDWSNQTKH